MTKRVGGLGALLAIAALGDGGCSMAVRESAPTAALTYEHGPWARLEAEAGPIRPLPSLGTTTLLIAEPRAEVQAKSAVIAGFGEHPRETGRSLILKFMDVRARITIHVAAVTVTQKYHNPHDRRIEAVYTFPLPEDASVRGFVMTIGDRHIRGIVREREEARRIYLEARRQGYTATLLTRDQPGVLTQIAHIEPGRPIDVRLTYFHTLRCAGGAREFVFPLAAGRRGGEIPPGEVALDLGIDAGSPIEEVSSPSHEIAVERPDPARARVSLRPGGRIPARDFVLRYRVSGREIRGAMATHRDAEGGTFTLVLHPPAALEDVPPTAREMIFLLHGSGRAPDAARRFVERGLKRLGPEDAFSVGAAAPRAATPDNISRALRDLPRLMGEGTADGEDLKAALALPPDPGRFRIIVLLTDGPAVNGTGILAEVRRNRGAARVFGLGIGAAADRPFLEGLARAGRGLAIVLDPEGPGDEAFQKIERPALTDIRIDWGGMAVSEVYPDPMPDLFVDRPVVLVGRFQGEGRATVRVRGMVAGRPYEMVLTADLDAPSPQDRELPVLWARAGIAALYDQMAASPEPEGFIDRIRRLALRHGLLCHFTAFITVDALGPAPDGK